MRVQAAVTAALWIGGALASSAAAPRTITYEKGTGNYEIALLELALRHTVATEGAFRLQELGQELTEDRAIAELNNGVFDVTYLVLTPARERLVLPVRIDLDRGIQGYRVFLVHRDNLAAFAQVRSLDELRTRFTAGFGAQWADLGILQANGFRVVTAASSANLYPMLQGKRFDFFPRGINEVWDNLAQHQDAAPDMAVEPTLGLFYPLVQCFVVARHNPQLARRIQRGLEASLKDGSMKRLFLRFHADFIRKANIPDRLFFTLSNPALPAGGPAIDPSWWAGGGRLDTGRRSRTRQSGP
jgi:hypothetical protein